MNAFYPRTITVISITCLCLVAYFSNSFQQIWIDLLPAFEWMETTWLGVAGKTWGALFAVVEAFHLLAMALLGGAILVSDGRLLGLLFTDFPADDILARTHKLFAVGLIIIVLTGVFMACGVALKIYYLPVYWFKMAALAIGVCFVFFIKRPLFANGVEQVNGALVKLMAVSSLMIWFTVAACGRWIGFS
jgi:hypothetical protein